MNNHVKTLPFFCFRLFFEKHIVIILLFSLISKTIFSQVVDTTKINSQDSTIILDLKDFVISASRIPEEQFNSINSTDVFNCSEEKNNSTINSLDATTTMKGVNAIVPSIGFKVINARGFSNTTNVRFAQLIDGIDNQAPHIGAPIGNSLGANELDINKIELLPGTTATLYGVNATNGLVNIITKNPFDFPGATISVFNGINRISPNNNTLPYPLQQINFRFAEKINEKWAWKVCLGGISGKDFEASNFEDLAPNINSSTGLYGQINPGKDLLNTYGDESTNRRVLTLGGKKYYVSRTGYKESELTDYQIKNFKGDLSIHHRYQNGEIIISNKVAIINSIYQRSNRFVLSNYKLNQSSLIWQNDFGYLKIYSTFENTGNSYNLRSLAENLDRSFKSDDSWFLDYANSFNNAILNGKEIDDAHQTARIQADRGRLDPGSSSFDEMKASLININNWDLGAALKVKSFLTNGEIGMNWNEICSLFIGKNKISLLSGVDWRRYSIIPDGNYFINPNPQKKNLDYSKYGGFIQASSTFKSNLKVTSAIRIDKCDYFKMKLNPRITISWNNPKKIQLRIGYQSGYRFPSIFEGFSNVNSGGVKRVGGLRIMSEGIFENSYTKSSIEKFQAKVNSDMNNLGISQDQAIIANTYLLKINPYTYLQPEHLKSIEGGIRAKFLHEKLFIDIDGYASSFDNFIAQVEASVPLTNDPDSIAFFLYEKNKQLKYRLWTNSKSRVISAGGSFGIQLRLFDEILIKHNISIAKLYNTENGDGLEDGFNTPTVTTNLNAQWDDFYKRFGFGVQFHYQTSYKYISFLVSGMVPSFFTIDANLTWISKNRKINFKAGANNAFNQYYYSILGGPSIGGIYYFTVNLNL